MKFFRLLIAFNLLFLSGCGLSSTPSEPEGVQAEMFSNGGQKITVTVKHGYQPNKILAKAGAPLRISFFRDEEPGAESCVEELLIPALNIQQQLPAQTTTIIEIPPQPAGELTFECGMHMQTGTIVFSE